MATDNDALALAFALWGMGEEEPRRTYGAPPPSKHQLRKAKRAARKVRLGSIWSMNEAELRAAAVVLPEDTFDGYLVLMHSDQGGCTARWCAKWRQTLAIGARFGRSVDYGPTAAVKTIPVSRALVERIWEVQGDLASGL